MDQATLCLLQPMVVSTSKKLRSGSSPSPTEHTGNNH
jgi:hypothetical protein